MENSEVDKRNTVYEAIDNYSIGVSYVSVSIAGGMTFGVKGILIGLGVNLLDDLLINNGFSKNKHFTEAFLGITLGYNFYPSWILGLMGGVGSIVITQDALKNYSDCLSNILVNALLSIKIVGFPGFKTIVILSVADQFLIENNITNKFYMSYGLLGMVSFSLMFGNSILIKIGGVALGFMLSNKKNIMFSIIEPTEIWKDLYSIYLKLVPQDQLDKFIREYSVVLLSSQISINQLKIIFLKYQQNSMYQFEHIDDRDGGAIKRLTYVTIKFILFAPPYALLEFVCDILNSFYQTKLYVYIDDNLRKILFYDEVAVKISFDKSNMLLVDNLRQDSKIISKDGSKLVVDYITKSIKGVCGIGVVIRDAPEILIYLVLYNKGTEYISHLLSELENKYEIQIKEQESFVSTVFKHDMNNIRIITESGGALYSYNQLQFEYEKLRKNELAKEVVLYSMSSWRSLESIFNFISTYYLVGYKVGMGFVNFDERINVHYSCMQVSIFFAWSGEKAQEKTTLYQSMDRLNNFINKTLFNENNDTKNIDSITREKVAINKLIILDLSVIVANRKLVQVDHLELEFGNVYAITGPSGSGKSSFISKIVGTINNNIGGEGKIFYPEDAKLILVSQQIYFPLKKALVEILFYPKEVNLKKIKLLEELLIRSELSEYKLNQVEDWYNVLSGGQKQKIKILSSIVREPNILILDEVFNGLDKNSIYLMQSIIIEKLPNILIISIDHNVLENNKTGFYTNTLSLVDGELISLNGKIDYKTEYAEFCNIDTFEAMISYNYKCFNYDNSDSYYV